jgi:hypothetical protein
VRRTTSAMPADALPSVSSVRSRTTIRWIDGGRPWPESSGRPRSSHAEAADVLADPVEDETSRSSTGSRARHAFLDQQVQLPLVDARRRHGLDPPQAGVPARAGR